MKTKGIAILIICMTSISTNLFAEEEQPTTATQQQASNTLDTNKLVGQAFLAKNMSSPGVITLPDGLQYRIIKQGNGPIPSANATVTVNYEGRLINGTVFDSSYKRGEPTKFQVSDVIRGWTEALQRMPQGSTWELYIPASLAYGESGMPPAIGPNETLIFKVELLDISK